MLNLDEGNSLKIVKPANLQPGEQITGYFLGIHTHEFQSIKTVGAEIRDELGTINIINMNRPLARGLGAAEQAPYHLLELEQLGGTTLGYYVIVTYKGKEVLKRARNKPEGKRTAMDYVNLWSVSIDPDRKIDIAAPDAPTPDAPTPETAAPAPEAPETSDDQGDW